MLTAIEVRLHNAKHPNTALGVVCQITLDKAGGAAARVGCCR